MAAPSRNTRTRVRRLTRDEKKARTREQLLDAAGRVFLRRGFFAASIDEVAEEAGFSKGAVYSNFTDKEDLLLALVEARTELRRRRVVELVDPDAPMETQAREGSEEFNHILQEEQAWNGLFLEFWVCLARNPALQERFATRHRAMKMAVAKQFEDRATRAGRPLPLPAEDLATALFAMGTGFSLERLADPDGVPEHLFGVMIANFLAGLEHDEQTK
jgi:AcrR family transcriptional regulator